MYQKRKFLLYPFLYLLMLLCISVRAQQLSAQDFILKLSEDVLQEIKSDKQLLAGDQKKLKQLADSKVLPHVDTERLTGRVVGRAWRDATPEQRKKITAEFQDLLMRTYSGAMSQAKNARISLIPNKNKIEADDKKVVIYTKIANPGAEAAEVAYRLENVNGAWVIYDVSVLGVWLSQSYANVFAAEIQKGGLDGLIDALKEKNKSALETRK